MNARGGETFDSARARAEIDALLAGSIPACGPLAYDVRPVTEEWLSVRGEGFVITQLWAGEDLHGVYDKEWEAADELAASHLRTLTAELDARWGANVEAGMRAAVWSSADGAPLPPLYEALRSVDCFGDLRVWGPVRGPGGGADRWVAVSVNQIDGDTPHFLVAVVTDRPLVEPVDSEG